MTWFSVPIMGCTGVLLFCVRKTYYQRLFITTSGYHDSDLLCMENMDPEQQTKNTFHSIVCHRIESDSAWRWFWACYNYSETRKVLVASWSTSLCYSSESTYVLVSIPWASLNDLLVMARWNSSVRCCHCGHYDLLPLASQNDIRRRWQRHRQTHFIDSRDWFSVRYCSYLCLSFVHELWKQFFRRASFYVRQVIFK